MTVFPMSTETKKKRKSTSAVDVQPPVKRVKNKFKDGYVAPSAKAVKKITPKKVKIVKYDNKSPKQSSEEKSKRKHRGKAGGSFAASKKGEPDAGEAAVRKTKKGRKKRKMSSNKVEGDDKKVNKVGEGKESAKKKEKKVDKVEQEPVSKMEGLKSQLLSSRFRYINEQLYTTTSGQAVEMFEKDPESFVAYHQGYTRQVEKWPKNPLDSVYAYLKAHASTSSTIADMGCGEAKLHAKLSHRGFTNLHSFDLCAVNDLVTVSSMDKVPLENESVDYVTFCLSLMGTNIIEFVKEANRILKPGGIMIIAEIRSRLPSIRKFVRGLEMMGFESGKAQSLGGDMFLQLVCTKKGKPKTKRPLGLELQPCYYKKR